MLHSPPLCLFSGFLFCLFGQWSPPTRCLVFPPHHVLRSGETWSTRCLFTFFQPYSLQTRHKRSVGQFKFCWPHVYLKSALTTTFMTVVFYCWCLTGRGNLIKWVTVLMNVCLYMSVCVHQLAQEHCVKVSLCCQGLSLLPAGPACHVRGRLKGGLKMDWEW